MELTNREWWGVLHGMVLGALFLLAFAGGLAELWSLRPSAQTHTGLRASVRRIGFGVTSMAVLAWLTSITGTFVVYPWYRAADPASAKSRLLADPRTADWHMFAMEWKEHIAWFSPILATAVAFIVLAYRGHQPAAAHRDDRAIRPRVRDCCGGRDVRGTHHQSCTCPLGDGDD